MVKTQCTKLLRTKSKMNFAPKNISDLFSHEMLQPSSYLTLNISNYDLIIFHNF